jgi:hypothetical protein
MGQLVPLVMVVVVVVDKEVGGVSYLVEVDFQVGLPVVQVVVLSEQ